MRYLKDISALHNVPVLVRAALNVPVDNGTVANEYRLRRALPTIQFLQKAGARVILISHLGEKGTETLAPVAAVLGRFLSSVSFCTANTGPETRAAVRALLPGSVLVLENLRRNKGEVANDPAFAQELASLADVFVQDSFDTCHRSHASMVGVPALLPAYAGLLLEEEVRELSKALSPEHPALTVIGGAKFSTKQPVLKALINAYDALYVAGALANDFLKAKGLPVGKSLVGETDTTEMNRLLSSGRLRIPVDVRVVAQTDRPSPKDASVKKVADVSDADVILDIGPESGRELSELVQNAKTILWNGPLGNYENGFTEATDDLARAIAASGAHSIVGGGDTIASIERLKLFSKFSFVSTGGGAMLDFLAYGTLPGITALN